ncbi:MAG: CerR family C-terminal domain-containing protein [Phenylobacterium sp.]|uniref:TetR family transcriptional regulator n=1 Tax=Phenylobacterium sp. TaxID=1871053 RepID=UPI0025DDF245|nr:TetR family transcriptional regulator [Phenylobacterium sp.]MCA6299940.1 CerR family C-terminal domain-containing protein [Phenylobacterium sp.]
MSNEAPIPQRLPAVRRIGRPPLGTDQHGTLLDIALQIFARDGFDGAAVSNIAQQAGMGQPLVHYHFGSKENLWRATIAHAFGGLEQILDTASFAVEDLEPTPALKFLIRAFIHFASQHPNHAAIIMAESRSLEPRFTWLVETYLAPLHRLADELIARAVAAGEIRPIPAVHLTTMVVGPTVLYFGGRPIIERLYGADLADAAIAESFADAMVDVFFKGIALPKPQERGDDA